MTSVRKQIQSMQFYRHSKLTHAIASIALRVFKSEKRKFSSDNNHQFYANSVPNMDVGRRFPLIHLGIRKSIFGEKIYFFHWLYIVIFTRLIQRVRKLTAVE